MKCQEEGKGCGVWGVGGRSSGPADPKLAGFLVSPSKELMSDVTGDQSRGLKAGGVICTRDKTQNKKKKKVQTFPEHCKNDNRA